VRLSPLGTAATTGLLYQPQMIDDGDCGVIGGMKFGRGNRSTRRKPAQAPLCPPQIPHDQTLARTRTTSVGSQRITAWATARPPFGMNSWRIITLSFSDYMLTSAAVILITIKLNGLVLSTIIRMFIIYRHIKFHLPSFKGSLVIITNTGTKCRF
jgi:hypothetical protein